jgi:hypothetical protein
MSRVPKIVIPGLNRGAGIPSGGIVGRTRGSGNGPAELLGPLDLRLAGVATIGHTNQVIAASISSAVSTVDSSLTSLSTAISTAASAPGAGITSTTENSNFTTNSTYNTYYVTTSGGAITATLHASPSDNEVVEIWDVSGNAGTNPISLNGNGNNIAGESTVSNAIQIAYGHAKLQFMGSQWLAQLS